MLLQFLLNSFVTFHNVKKKLKTTSSWEVLIHFFIKKKIEIKN